MKLRNGLLACAALAMTMIGPACAADFTVKDALSYPFVSEMTAAKSADRIAWVRIVKGVRNVWTAAGPDFKPAPATQFTADDGQELTNLAFSPDGSSLVFVRGGDHDSNWPAKGDLQPDPTSTPEEPKLTLWLADSSGAKPAVKLTEGDAPAISKHGVLAYVKNGQVWTATLDGKETRRLFFDRGQDGELVWSPDGSRLAFVSRRGDHSFIGIYNGEGQPLTWLAPSTNYDVQPVWSPDGLKLAFARLRGEGGTPEPLLKRTPQPWSIMVADARTGEGRKIWTSPATLHGSFPDVAGETNLKWGADGRLAFLAELDNWPHLYSIAESGGEAKLLTPGAFMVEHVALSRDGKALIYSANTGATKDDDDRRHLFRVALSGGAPAALTSGTGLEWSPVAVSSGAALISADAQRPGAVAVVGDKDGAPKLLDGQAPPAEFPGAKFVTPKQVSFKAPDGLVIHGQLFEAPGGPAKKPAVVFVHGGPPRQMMLGWSYMRYYANAYAMNQYLAAHGFVVLSVNYRRGIGYGWDFQHPEAGGWAGSSEYQDVAAGGRYLQTLPEVDGARIGIWGGSYGGLLTALALARNSDLFKAGVDYHGVHDWARTLMEETTDPRDHVERGDRDEAIRTAWKASPVADVEHWTSPVLLIHGDDDRNVRFHQTVDLARRLEAKCVDFEELVIPDDIHDFLRYANWLKADEATAEFLARKLKAGLSK